MKTEAVFCRNWNENWIEIKLFKVLKEFILIIFASSITKSQALKLKSLSLEILNIFSLLRRSLNELQRKSTVTDSSITCKVHHLSHYHQLIPIFGPLIYFATFHYEHKHQVCKSLARNIRNFDTLGLTVHRRHQQLLGMMECQRGFFSLNFYGEHQSIRPTNQLPKPNECYVKVKYDDRPYKLKKNVLRKVLESRFEWFHTTMFYCDKETSDIFCEGQIMSISNSTDSTDNLPKLIPRTKKQHRVEIDVTQFIPQSSLYHKNDYFYIVNDECFLIRMSY